MVVLIDDRLLRAVITDAEPSALRRLRRGDPVYTTGHFYVRLCRAIASPSVAGVLSRSLDVMDDAERASFVAQLTELPADVGMLPLRELAWRIGQLAGEHRLNVLGLEVLAAAETLGATVCFAAGNEGPMLLEAIENIGLGARVL